MSLDQEVLRAGSQVEDSDGLRDFISKFVGTPYRIVSAAIDGSQGERTAPFACAVVRPAGGGSVSVAGAGVSAEEVAAVIDVHEELTLDSLRMAYSRIAESKRLSQALPTRPGRGGQRSEVLGVVLGFRSLLTLEAIALEMEQLNRECPGTEWPDMVALAGTGVVQYTAQFPGENITGDFFLPGTALAYTAPMYIVMVMKPSGQHTLNRVLAFLCAHLALFEPGASVPRFTEIIDGIPNNGVTVSGYQCNLAGQIVPVPRQFYNDRYLAPLPFSIEDARGRVLASVRYLPWQDGGVILLRGEFPLEMLLVLLGQVAQNAGIVRRPGGQISYAMPITERAFLDMLALFQRRSNMTVRPDQTNWVVKKFADEGTSTPVMARLLLGMMKLRDAALSDPKERDDFDKAYQSVTTPLLDARARMKKIADLWQGHAQRVSTGEVVRLQGRAVHVDESVDSVLGQETDAFLSAATRSVKTGMQAVAAVLGSNIGFMFQKQQAFESGLTLLTAADSALGAYLRESRVQWLETLIGRRNAIEHEAWRLPDVTYQRDGGTVRAHEPVIDGQGLTTFVGFIFDRLTCFAEEVTAHLLERRLMTGVTITQVPLAERPEEAPERFRLTLAVGGLAPWSIRYHSSEFERT